MGFLLVIAGLALGFAQLAAGFYGIEHTLGFGWAFGALFLLFAFRISLPITIGAFFGASQVWGWHWSLALLFAAPGLLFVVPGVIGALIGGLQGAGFRRTSS